MVDVTYWEAKDEGRATKNKIGKSGSSNVRDSPGRCAHRMQGATRIGHWLGAFDRRGSDARPEKLV